MSDTVWKCKYDDFRGTVIGEYTTRQGKKGFVLQQVGTRVVHVYGLNSIDPEERPQDHD